MTTKNLPGRNGSRSQTPSPYLRGCQPLRPRRSRAVSATFSPPTISPLEVEIAGTSIILAELGLLPGNGRHGRADGDGALDLFRIIVHRGSAIGRLAHAVDFARVEASPPPGWTCLAAMSHNTDKVCTGSPGKPSCEIPLNMLIGSILPSGPRHPGTLSIVTCPLSISDPRAALKPRNRQGRRSRGEASPSLVMAKQRWS